MDLRMTPAHRLLGVSVLATGFLSLLLWIYIAVRIVTCDVEVCYIDWYSPFFGWFPFISFLEAGLLAFVLSFVCTVLYLTFWWPKMDRENVEHGDTRPMLMGESSHKKKEEVTNLSRHADNAPKASSFLRALLITTWLYSLLLLFYLMARLIINQAPINSPFIDYLFPWFTFLRLAILAFILGFLSFSAYLALFWRSDHRWVAQRLN